MKYIVILVLTLLGYGSIKAQKGQPIRPYKESGYSKQDVKTFALSDDPVAVWWRTNVVTLVNNALAASGETVKVDESNISWIIDQVVYENRKFGAYVNSHLIDGQPGWFTDKDGWEGMVGVFKYGKCNLVLYKTICMNLLDIPVTPIGTIPVSTTVTTTAAGQPIIINNYQVMENSGNSTNKNSNEVDNGMPTGSSSGGYSGYEPPLPPPYLQEQRRVQVALNLHFGNRQMPMPRRRGYVPPPPPPQNQIRTMPPGIPANNGGGGGGLPADPRRMPGGIGFRH